MKQFLWILPILLLIACGKKNEVPQTDLEVIQSNVSQDTGCVFSYGSDQEGTLECQEPNLKSFAQVQKYLVSLRTLQSEVLKQSMQPENTQEQNQIYQSLLSALESKISDGSVWFQNLGTAVKELHHSWRSFFSHYNCEWSDTEGLSCSMTCYQKAGADQLFAQLSNLSETQKNQIGTDNDLPFNQYTQSSLKLYSEIATKTDLNLLRGIDTTCIDFYERRNQ